MSAKAIKIHFIAERPKAGFRVEQVTACGKRGMLCYGYNIRKGNPGEFDTATCDRFEATYFADEVTCVRCLKSAAKTEALREASDGEGGE